MAVRLILFRGGYAFGGLVSLDAYLDQQRRDYFAAIRRSLARAYQRGYDASPFVVYFIEAIGHAAEHVLGRIKAMGALLNDLRTSAIRDRLPARLIDGLAYAWVNGNIRPADYARVTGRAGAAATRDLQVAAKLGYLAATGRTRTRRYMLGPTLARYATDRITRYQPPR